ncbi:MAG: hypothetical protein COA79_02230 [Planctomycetota bacterium]|nr:MAG: hypothetical protein COA79_02230 [Planctomycetota bacterium]
MSVIKVLPTIVQNKIAAGEVVERPSAAIKELIENSIDAKATLIRVDLEEGGKKLLRVIDNGSGISEDDLILAVTQHATSKIASADDLFAVETMGFRGEALASIAAVTQFSITSKIKNQEAYQLQVEGGHVKEVCPSSCQDGTVIEARNLFFNTPVRMKFLKADRTELSRANEIISCIALANPSVGFHLTHNGKNVFQLPPNQKLMERIQAVLPLNLSEAIIEIPPFTGDHFTIRGYLGSPYFIRPRRDHQYFFINGRVVKDKLLHGAISKVYEGLIPNGKHPVVLLFLDIDPSEVDVNVHPTKIEVRFSQSNSIFSAILKVCKDLLEPETLTQSIADSRNENSMPMVDFSFHQQNSNLNNSNAVNPLEASRSYDSDPALRSSAELVSSNNKKSSSALDILKDMYAVKDSSSYSRTDHKAKSFSNFVAEKQTNFDFEGASNQIPQIENVHREIYSNSNAEAKKIEDIDFNLVADESSIITIDKTFLIANINNELYMVDQHALHERMSFEKLKSKLDSGSVGSQQLLVPFTLDMKETDKAVLLDNQQELSRLGFELEDFGKDGLIVRGVPVEAPNLDIENFFFDLIQNFEFSNKASLDKGRHKLCATIACHSSLRAGDVPTHADKVELFRYAYQHRDLLTCPHGRPSVIIFTIKDFNRMFHR